jgi:hypothetical protein
VPLNVKLCALDAEPMQELKADKAPEVVKVISLSVMEPVPDLLPIFRMRVSVTSGVISSIVFAVMVKLLTPPGTVIVPSPLSITPLENVKVDE